MLNLKTFFRLNDTFFFQFTELNDQSVILRHNNEMKIPDHCVYNTSTSSSRSWSYSKFIKLLLTTAHLEQSIMNCFNITPYTVMEPLYNLMRYISTVENNDVYYATIFKPTWARTLMPSTIMNQYITVDFLDINPNINVYTPNEYIVLYLLHSKTITIKRCDVNYKDFTVFSDHVYLKLYAVKELVDDINAISRRFPPIRSCLSYLIEHKLLVHLRKQLNLVLTSMSNSKFIPA